MKTFNFFGVCEFGFLAIYLMRGHFILIIASADILSSFIEKMI